jgi:hypothetical protein
MTIIEHIDAAEQNMREFSKHMQAVSDMSGIKYEANSQLNPALRALAVVRAIVLATQETP